MKYTHNPKKPNGSYHLATDFGTVCKMENSDYYQYQVRVDEIPKRKIICGMCNMISNRRRPKPNFARNSLLMTILKLYNGVLPSSEEWSQEDQENVESAKRLT